MVDISSVAGLSTLISRMILSSLPFFSFILTGDMMPWKWKFTDSTKNSAVAASGEENIASSIADIRKYGPFNYLEVNNRDSVDIEIRLDGLTTGGYVTQVPKNATAVLHPEDESKWFMFFKNVNLDTANAQTANAILFRWGRVDAL